MNYKWQKNMLAVIINRYHTHRNEGTSLIIRTIWVNTLESKGYKPQIIESVVRDDTV